MFATTEIEKSKADFARFGVPVVCHTDNGSQFISKEYDRFAEEYGFRHTTSSPYHPKGNGRAEAAVKVAKSMLKKAHDLHNAMLMYRNTPPQGTTYSPAQRMLWRRTRTTLPTAEQVLAPTMTNFQVVEDEILKKRSDSKSYYDKTAGGEHKLLEIGSYAYAKPRPTHKGKPWIYGEVIRNDGTRSYKIQTPRGFTMRRNRVPLRPTSPSTDQQPHPKDTTVTEQRRAVIEPVENEPQRATQPEQFQTTPLVQNQDSSHEQISDADAETPSTLPPQGTVTRSGREVKTPVRFNDYVLK